MSPVVWKYVLHGHAQTLVLPLSGTRFLAVGFQHGVPVLWVEHDEPEGTETAGFTVRTVLTGGSPPDRGEYVATYMIDLKMTGVFVGHVYVVRPSRCPFCRVLGQHSEVASLGGTSTLMIDPPFGPPANVSEHRWTCSEGHDWTVISGGGSYEVRYRPSVAEWRERQGLEGPA